MRNSGQIAPPPLVPSSNEPNQRAAEEYAAGRGYQAVERAGTPGFWRCVDVDGGGWRTPWGAAFEVRNGKVVA